MHIESVIAHAFGPFSNETLKLGKGMTVIHGPNESGKSTWHAALYAGLCGVRRGPGTKKEDQDFRSRYSPWDSGDWEVATTIRLDSGLHLELRHDLAGKVACSARDADSGKDYSDEIMFEKAPDGSRWLGLNRRTFLNTACVRQGDIQALRDNAEALQEHLQRAAATAGTDTTAAKAIAEINGFLKDSVGTEHPNSKKPLRASMDRLARARDALEGAQANHSEYLKLQEEIDQLQSYLHESHNALESARKEHLRALDEIEQVRYKIRNSLTNLENHQSRKPPQPENVEAGNLTAQELSSLANDLSLEEPVIDPTVDENVQSARDKLESLERPDRQEIGSRTISPFLLPLITLLRVVSNFFRFLFGRRKPQVNYEAIALASEELRIAEGNQGEVRYRRDGVRRKKKEAREIVKRAGLPETEQEIIEVADSMERAVESQKEMSRWEEEDRRLLEIYNNASQGVKEALKRQGVEVGQNILADLANHKQESEQRVNQVQEKFDKVQTAISKKRGEFEQFGKNVLNVAEAEEEFDDSEVALYRVKTLARTLNMTRDLLSESQESVHRSLAPKLLKMLRPHISKITSGRYQDVRVNVESLNVQVCGDGKNWRNANLLSQGTADQIYLLLRVVMSGYLTKDKESCPLILDDITVNCDPERQEAILCLLHEISGEQQVILFSQEPETLAWAQAHLSDEKDSLIILNPKLVNP